MYVSSILQVEVDYTESSEDEALAYTLLCTVKVKAQRATRGDNCVEG